jgi:hypothetical protein
MKGSARQIVEASERMATAGNQLRQVEDRLQISAHQDMKLQSKQIRLEASSRELPVLINLTHGLNNQATRIMGGFADLKDKAAKLLMLVRDMEDRSIITMRQSYKKNMFVDGILKICRASLINIHVCDEVQRITGEITSGYEGQSIPMDVSSMLMDVDRAVKDVQQKAITL